jgi:uncharacterized cupredoxin-like copper-binding protein
MKTTTTIAIALIALSTAAAPARSHEHHAHESYSAGEPGDAAKPSRTIAIEMSEMTYGPIRIEAKHGVRLGPKQSAEILWRFTKPGTFEYSCLIPDHREYGMVGHVTVK